MSEEKSVVVEENTTTTNTTSTVDTTKSNKMMYAIIAVIVLLAIGLIALALFLNSKGSTKIESDEDAEEFLDEAFEKFSKYDGVITMTQEQGGEEFDIRFDFRNDVFDLSDVMEMIYPEIKGTIYADRDGDPALYINDGDDWFFLTNEELLASYADIADDNFFQKDENSNKEYAGIVDCPNSDKKCHKFEEQGSTSYFDVNSKLLVAGEANGLDMAVSYKKGEIEIPDDAEDISDDETKMLELLGAPEIPQDSSDDSSDSLDLTDPSQDLDYSEYLKYVDEDGEFDYEKYLEDYPEYEDLFDDLELE